MNIKDKNGISKITVPENDKCIYHKSLMEEEYILLNFNSDTVIPFAKGDYIDTEFGRFSIVYLDPPKFSKSGGYTYDVKFHAPWERWRNRILFYSRQNGSEKSWKMTHRPEIFLDIVIDNIQKAGFGDYAYAVDPELTEMKFIEFNSNNIIDALSAIAEAWETEWWIRDGIIYLSRCEHGNAIELKAEDAISGDIGISDSSSEYITRLYAFGSTRNLPTNYRQEESGSYDVIEGVVEKRLKLPQGIPYVDAWANMSDEDIVEGVVVMEHVYPRFTGTIKTISMVTYTETIENEDGTTTVNEWDAYRFTDDGFVFDKDYIIEGQELRMTFQSGKLAGMEFAVVFEPDNLSQVFEIVRNEDYGIPLPGDNGNDAFLPQVGDTYVLYGYDARFVADNLIGNAEYELYDEALKYIAKKSQRNLVYSVKSNPIRCAGYTEVNGSLVFSNYNIIDLDVGQSVRLNSDALGIVVSRVRSFEKKLVNKYIADYEIGDDERYSRTGSMQDEIDAITTTGSQTSAGNLPIIRLLDTTLPTDNNVFSALRSRKEFLRKNVVDRTSKKIIFDDGLALGNYIPGDRGGRMDGDGNAELLTMVVRHLLRSAEFRNGFTGEGWQLWVDEWGLSNLEIDRLTVRQIMTVFELLIERIRAVGGQIIVSAANGKIKSVEDTGDVYKVTFEGENYFVEHDLIRCQVFAGVENNGQPQNPVRGYWVEVQSVTDGKVVIPKSEFTEWATLPMEGDECVLMGNTENPYRQNLISIAATEDGQPRIDIMDGVNAKNFVGCLRARLGNLDGIGDSNFPLDKQPQGNGLYADNAYLRGTFLLSTGEDIKTKFEVMEGKIEAMVEGLRQDFMQDKGFLANPNFYEGMMYWKTSNDIIFYKVGSKWIWADNIISLKNNFAVTEYDGERNICRIRNNYIQQDHDNYLSLPEIVTNDAGLKEPASVYISFFYKVVTPGTLNISFVGVDNTGFIEYESLNSQEYLESTDGKYQQYTTSGLWNGTGDFMLSFTGEIHLYMVILTTDRLESLKYLYRTLFEQAPNLVKISAAVFDQDEQALQETGLVIKPEGGGIYCQDADGNFALIGAMITEGGHSKIVLQAEDININGAMSLTGYIHKSRTVITPNNISDYLDADFNFWTVLDVRKAGTYISVEGTFSEPPTIYMPGLYDGEYSISALDKIRGYVGNSLIIYCNSPSGMGVSGRCLMEGTSSYVSFNLADGEFISLVCKCKNINGREDIFWEGTKGTSIQPTLSNDVYYNNSSN